MNIREYNVGNSDYSKHKIQPWDIWREYSLNPWDADIVKRVLRTKAEPTKSKEDARIMDYEKIIHICRERIRQLEEEKQAQELPPEVTGWSIGTVYKPTVTFSLNEKEIEAYANFQNLHLDRCKSCCSVAFNYDSGIGIGKIAQCNVCKESKDITDYNTW